MSSRDGSGFADEANVLGLRRLGDFASQDRSGIIDASRQRQRRVAVEADMPTKQACQNGDA